MIEIKLDKKLQSTVEKKLGNLKHKAPDTLRDVINQTARQAKEDLLNEAQRTYTIESKSFNKAVKLRRASKGNLQATISAKGKPLELNNFKISQTGGTIEAQVLKSGTLKPLERNDGIKAFNNNVARKGQFRVRKTAKGEIGTEIKHITIAQRRTDKRLPIKTLYSPSIPKMLGNEKRVFGTIKPRIQRNLTENIIKQIIKTLESRI